MPRKSKSLKKDTVFSRTGKLLKGTGRISFVTLAKILKKAKPQEIEISEDGIFLRYKKEF